MSGALRSAATLLLLAPFGALSFGRKGGENSTKVTFEDMNFLGRGKRLTFARSANVDRTAWELGCVDPNLFGSCWQLSGELCSAERRRLESTVAPRPFYALDTRWSAGLTAADETSDVSRYSFGHVVERLQMQERHFEIGGGFSEGLRDGWTTRYLCGIRYDASKQALQPRHSARRTTA